MIRRAKLYARINEGSGVFSRVSVAFRKNGRAIAPDGHVTGYLVRKGGKFEHVGQDLDTAVTRLRQEEALLSGDVVPVQPSAPGQRIKIANAIAEYKQEIQTLDKSKATILMYSNALDGFATSCKKTFIDEIDRKDILSYIQWMRDNLQERVEGGQNQTIRNRLTYLGVFLGKQGIKLAKERNKNGTSDPGLLFYADRPKVVKKKPKKYDQATIDQLIEAADIDQKDYLMFLLWSGFRDEEAQYLQYSDFNWKNNTVTAHAKPHFGWRPKDAEERTVVLPGEVSKMMKRRMERPQRYADGNRKPGSDDLVFPNGDGRPDSHLIYRLHAVAKKAGINLIGQRAGHMFRKTAGSRVAKKLGLRAAMDFLGHSNVETTALYLAADDSNSKKSRDAFEEMYKDGD
jgi:integrase